MDLFCEVIVKGEPNIADTESLEFEFIPLGVAQPQVKSEIDLAPTPSLVEEPRLNDVADMDPLSSITNDSSDFKSITKQERLSPPDIVVHQEPQQEHTSEGGINHEIVVDVKCEALEHLRKDMMGDGAMAESSGSMLDQSSYKLSTVQDDSRMDCSGLDMSSQRCSQVFNSNGHLQVTAPFESESDRTKNYVTKSSESVASSRGGHNKGNLIDHRKTIPTEKKRFTCEICGDKFTYPSRLARHKITHTGEKPYKCDKCGISFARKSGLTTHMMIHTGEKPYHCDKCGKTFRHVTSLADHKRIHSDEKPYSCNICGMKFKRKGSVAFHESVHTGEKPYSCEKCGIKFVRKTNLTSHMMIHTGEKPYGCDKCGLTFRHHSSLTDHKRIHSDEKPYSCNKCGMKFKRKSGVYLHERIHSAERPYGCDKCDKTFKHQRSLAAHKTIHTGKKTFGCDLCGARFSTSSTLKTHAENHNGEGQLSCDV